MSSQHCRYVRLKYNCVNLWSVVEKIGRLHDNIEATIIYTNSIWNIFQNIEHWAKYKNNFVWRVLYSRIKSNVVRYNSTDVPVDRITSTFTVEVWAKQEAIMRRSLLPVDCYRTAQRYIPEDSAGYIHSCEYFKSKKLYLIMQWRFLWCDYLRNKDFYLQ
jgi:hypothetical protein